MTEGKRPDVRKYTLSDIEIYNPLAVSVTRYNP